MDRFFQLEQHHIPVVQICNLHTNLSMTNQTFNMNTTNLHSLAYLFLPVNALWRNYYIHSVYRVLSGTSISKKGMESPQLHSIRQIITRLVCQIINFIIIKLLHGIWINFHNYSWLIIIKLKPKANACSEYSWLLYVCVYME